MVIHKERIVTSKSSHSPTTFETIERRILFIRGQKVMLDRDLAGLYGVNTRALRQQVKRNLTRFPDDFMFQLSDKEMDLMVSQFVTPSRKNFGGYRPYVFTEHGVAMLSSVLNSEKAIQVNIAIIRTFVHLKNAFAGHREFAQKLRLLERKIGKQDSEIKAIFEAIHRLTNPHFEGFGYEENSEA